MLLGHMCVYKPQCSGVPCPFGAVLFPTTSGMAASSLPDVQKSLKALPLWLLFLLLLLPTLLLFACRDGYKVLIIGGGAAGITTASHYARKLPNHQVAVIEVCGWLSIAAGTHHWCPTYFTSSKNMLPNPKALGRCQSSCAQLATSCIANLWCGFSRHALASGMAGVADSAGSMAASPCGQKNYQASIVQQRARHLLKMLHVCPVRHVCPVHAAIPKPLLSAAVDSCGWRLQGCGTVHSPHGRRHAWWSGLVADLSDRL